VDERRTGRRRKLGHVTLAGRKYCGQRISRRPSDSRSARVSQVAVDSLGDVQVMRAASLPCRVSSGRRVVRSYGKSEISIPTAFRWDRWDRVWIANATRHQIVVFNLRASRSCGSANGTHREMGHSNPSNARRSRADGEIYVATATAMRRSIVAVRRRVARELRSSLQDPGEFHDSAFQHCRRPNPAPNPKAGRLRSVPPPRSPETIAAPSWRPGWRSRRPLGHGAGSAGPGPCERDRRNSL